MSPMGRMGRWGLLHPAHARGPEVTVPGGLSDAQLRTNYPSQKTGSVISTEPVFMLKYICFIP